MMEPTTEAVSSPLTQAAPISALSAVAASPTGGHHNPTPFGLCEKIALFRAVAEVGHCWELLAKQLPGRRRATVREFCNSYEQKAGAAQERNLARHYAEHGHGLADRLAEILQGCDSGTYDSVQYLLEQRTRDAWPSYPAEWCSFDLCVAGWPVAQCGRWVRGAGCGCKHLSESHPYGDEWELRDQPVAGEPLLQRVRPQPGDLPPGWTAERRHNGATPYFVYVSPDGDSVRTKKRAREVYEKGGTARIPAKLRGNAAAAEAAAARRGSSSSLCAACSGKHRAHTCGKQHAPQSVLVRGWPPALPDYAQQLPYRSSERV